MTRARSITKQIRFEVFKRDKFTCQYCGAQAPDIVLEVDHIEPKSKGGTDDLLNLITSCKECNRGKRDLKLDDHSVLAKQRRQIEELQERREQIELMLKWRQSLEDLESHTVEQIVDYINNKTEGFSVNESAVRNIEQLSRKFDLADILEAIDIAAKKYLRYDTSGNLIKESVETFFTKIGGILVLKNKSPIDRKLAYIKGICRNRFNYWDNRKGSMLLQEYVNSLREYGWNNEQILNDLEDELTPKTKEAKNWSAWKGLLEGWTKDIKKWERESDFSSNNKSYTLKQLQEIGKTIYQNQQSITPALSYLGKAFESFDYADFSRVLHETVIDYLLMVKDFCASRGESETQNPPRFWAAIRKHNLMGFFRPIDSMLRFHLDNAATTIIQEYFEGFGIESFDEFADKDLEIIIRAYQSHLESDDDKNTA